MKNIPNNVEKSEGIKIPVAIAFVILAFSCGAIFQYFSNTCSECDNECKYFYVSYDNMASMNTTAIIKHLNDSDPQWQIFGEVVNGDLLLSIPFNQRGDEFFRRMKIPEDYDCQLLTGYENATVRIENGTAFCYYKYIEGENKDSIIHIGMGSYQDFLEKNYDMEK
jgi:hypothetical protein